MALPLTLSLMDIILPFFSGFFVAISFFIFFVAWSWNRVNH